MHISIVILFVTPRTFFLQLRQASFEIVHFSVIVVIPIAPTVPITVSVVIVVVILTTMVLMVITRTIVAMMI